MDIDSSVKLAIIAAFASSFDQLVATVGEKRSQILTTAS